jgi:signal transduction histidine kinase/FixJ family two-component response regulator
VADDRQAFLSTLPASRGERRVALAAMLVSLAVFLAAAPFAKMPLPQVGAFIPAYQSALVVNDLITAVLLFSQFNFLRSWALLALACGYLFTAFLAVAHALTFPGLFAATGLLGAGPQSTAWLYMFWHGGFPLFVLGYALLKHQERDTNAAPPGSRRAILFGIAGVFALACAATLLATAGQRSLPAIMQGNHYTPEMIAVVSSVWMLSLLALGILWWRRPHSVLDLWLMVVMCAWLFDMALAAVLNAGRFDLGFYAGRLYGLLAASLVLAVLLVENGKLYSRLVRTHASVREKHRRVQERTTELTAVNEELEEARQEALAANRAKSTFLATMSHEIRTPMNGVLGMLELLSLSKLDGEQRTTLGIVRESGRSLLRIIDDLLDFSKIEAGKLDLRPEVASVENVVERVCNIYSGNASSKGLLLTRYHDPRISQVVMVDPLRLQQILNNFVSNAIKFTARGEVVVRADLVERRDGEDVVRFAVEDTGIGISREERQRLFQPFSQAAEDTSRRYGGTGLGLSICHRLAAMMGGAIEVESEVGAGTCMSLIVSLPVAEVQALSAPGSGEAKDRLSAVAARRAPPTPEQARREGTLVLAVDDHPINRMVLVKQINALGYAAEVAENGLEALDKWSAGGFAAVITDCNMPEMNGYELARHIRSCESRNAHPRTPIIACTANALGGEAENCYAAGMDDYLAKPIDLVQLSQKLEHWLPIPASTSANAEDFGGRLGTYPRLAAASPIDPSVLAEISAGDRDAERDILQRFKLYNSEDANLLINAVVKADLREVNHTSHRIKGASKTIGAMSLAAVCERLERASRANDLNTVTSNMEAFSEELDRVNTYVSSL